MNFLKHIAIAFYKSFYDVKWMAAERMKLGRAIGYFVIFFFIVVLASGSWLARGLSGKAQTFLAEITAEAPELSVSVQDETLSVNGLEQPYQKVLVGTEGDTTLLYVDTVTTSSVSIEEAREGIEDAMPALVITSKLIKVYDQDNTQVQTEYIKSVPAFSLTKDDVAEKILSLTHGIMPWLLVIIAIVMTLLLGGAKFIYLGLLAWLVYVVARADRQPVTFWQVFTIGIYAITVPILIQVTTLVIFHEPMPYIYTLLTFGYMFGAIFYGMKKFLQPPTSGMPEPPEIPEEKK